MVDSHSVIENPLTTIMKASLIFLVLFVGSSMALQCTVIEGSLKQIDASEGQVVGVNSQDQVYMRSGESWVRLPGTLQHVSVGPAGIWGVNKNNNIFKLVGGSWEMFNGLLKQIDAGGYKFIAGVNSNDLIFCLNRIPTNTHLYTDPLPWIYLGGLLKYYSCGPISCWGVNFANQIFVRKGVNSVDCTGNQGWQHIPGELSMIEVSTDGKVHGVNSYGFVYRRDGINDYNPAGTHWVQLNVLGRSKHVSYDLDVLWVIGQDNSIQACR